MDNRRAVPYARNLSGEGHARFVGRQREAESDALFAGVLYGNRNRTWGVIQIDMNNVGSQQNVDFIGPRSMKGCYTDRYEQCWLSAKRGLHRPSKYE